MRKQPRLSFFSLVHETPVHTQSQISVDHATSSQTGPVIKENGCSLFYRVRVASHQDNSWGFPGALNGDGIKEKLAVLSAQGCQDKRSQTSTLQYRVFPYNLKAKVRDQRMVTFLCAVRKERFLFQSCEISSQHRPLWCISGWKGACLAAETSFPSLLSLGIGAPVSHVVKPPGPCSHYDSLRLLPGGQQGRWGAAGKMGASGKMRAVGKKAIQLIETPRKGQVTRNLAVFPLVPS